MTRFLYLVRHGRADPRDGPLSQAVGAPPWRWLGLNQMNCAVTVLAYQPGLPAGLIIFNDAAHLPPELRWTGFPAAVTPASA